MDLQNLDRKFKCAKVSNARNRIVFSSTLQLISFSKTIKFQLCGGSKEDKGFTSVFIYYLQPKHHHRLNYIITNSNN